MSAYRTLADILEARLRERGDEICLVYEDGQLSYSDFADQVQRISGGFRRLGLVREQKVALLLPNCPQFLTAIFAISRLGGVFVPLNTALTAPELQYIVNHSEARFLLTTEASLPRVRRIRAECPALEQLVSLDSKEDFDVLSWEKFLSGTPPATPDIVVSPEELASITYTSGTTDRPKGVMLTQYAYAFAPQERAKALGWGPADRVLVVLPLFHVNALCHMSIAMMSVGGRILLRDRFSASRFWEDVKTHGVTTSSIMQTIPRILLNHPVRADDANNPLRQVVALLPPDVHLEFEERFGVTAVPSYSLTEDLLSVLGPLDKGKRKLGSSGVPIAGDVHKVRIVDEAGRPCAAGVRGEITKQSPTVMRGYYKNPEATAEALKNGWLHTGDIGYLDEDGFLYFVDRKKDMIKRGGENIASEEVERVLNAHPSIAESAVVAVADSIRQEEVKACIVLKPGLARESLPAQELWQFCGEHLAPFKVPRYLEYRSELPKTPSSKVQKNLLRDEGVHADVVDRLQMETDTARKR